MKNKRKYIPYNWIYCPSHPSENNTGFVRKYVLVAEKALGKPLPPNAIIHHIDGNQLNDNNDNLVICNNNSYHKLLHARTKSLKECGNVHKRKCWICQQYDYLDNLRRVPKGNSYRHNQCFNKFRSNWRKNRVVGDCPPEETEDVEQEKSTII